MFRKFILFLILIFSSCTNPYFRALEGSGNCSVMLEVRKLGGFELRFINPGRNNIKNLSLTFDGKYKHSLFGLYSMERGLIKDSVFKAGDTLTFQFTEDIDNMIYFNVDEREYIPNEIALRNNDCSTTWLLK